MSGLKISSFSGISPKLSSALLPENAAQSAVNVKLYSGELRSWRKEKRAVTVTGTPGTIYKFPDDPIWMSWSGDVSVVPGPINDTDEYPFYYAGDGTPKKTNYALATTGAGAYPRDYLELGVPSPAGAPTVTLTGTPTGNPETRAYIYTFVSEFGGIEEESAPSPPSAITTIEDGHTVTIGGFSALPTGKYNITKKRIYRTVTGTASTTFLFVGEISAATSTFVDNVTPANLGEEVPSLNYSTPPSNLAGLVSHPVGFLAGFAGKEIRFSEPFALHAWPVEYSLTLPYKVVGLAVFGQTIVALTEGNPYLLIGSDPSGISPEKIPNFEPCVSSRSIASSEFGVVYASPNGLVMITPGGTSVVTQSYMTRDDWQSFTPSSMLGEFYGGTYFGFYSESGEVRLLIIDPKAVGSPASTSFLKANATFVDEKNAKLFLATASDIYEWEGEPYSNLPYEWKSKLFVFPRPLNLGALQIDADFDDDPVLRAELEAKRQEAIELNQTLFSSALLGSFNDYVYGVETFNGSAMIDLPPEVTELFVNVTVEADREVILQKNITSADPIRLPSGFKAREWEFTLSGTVSVRALKAAESISELKAI